MIYYIIILFAVIITIVDRILTNNRINNMVNNTLDLDLVFKSDMVIGNIKSREIKVLKNRGMHKWKVTRRGNTLYLKSIKN